MSLFNFFAKRASSSVARDRLQILLAHERSGCGNSELIAKLQYEILEVIKRHVAIDQDKVRVRLDGADGGRSMLEIDVEMPDIPAQNHENVQ